MSEPGGNCSLSRRPDLVEPPDAEYVLQRTKGIHGFYGASSMERLPVEKAITETMKAYKAIRLKG